MPSNKIGLVFSEDYQKYNFGPSHPLRPLRLQLTYSLMEKLGLLKRTRNKKDRRIVFAKLTKSGLELLEEIEPLLNEIHRVHFSNLSKEELKEFNNMLIKNIEHTEKEKLTANRLL